MALEALEIKTIDRLKRSFSLGYNYDTSDRSQDLDKSFPKFSWLDPKT